MKLRYTILIFLVLVFSIDGLKSQSTNNNLPVLPLKSASSVLFGKDIIITDNPSRDQRQVSLCSAFNGWLYAVYSYLNSYQVFPGFTILKSTDNGVTWTVFNDGYIPLGIFFSSLDIVVTGDSVFNLKVFLAYVVSSGETTDIGEADVLRFNGETGVFEDKITIDYFSYFISIASDFIYPATNSNLYSIGILDSKYSSAGDPIIFRSSSNGGISIDNRKVLAGSGSRFHKVALTYGRSLSQNSGRYFAAWEEKADFTSNTGHIYTAHSEPNFNSSFTTPVMLDGLDPLAINNAKNPAIACQYNNTDNDSSNLTEVVLFDKYISSQNRYDIEGFYNKTATTSDHFTPFTLNLSSDSRQQPSINFNPFDATFMVTYYDSTSQKLPFLKNDFNLINADSWQFVSSGYNDSTNLAAPYPKVALNISQQKGANVWLGEGAGGNGIAMFDAPYSTYTGISGNNKSNNDRLFVAYPNPCKDFVNIGFELRNPGKVNIILYDLHGQSVGILTDQCFSSGKYNLRINVSGFTSGTYIYKFQTSEYIASGRLMVIK